MAEYLVLARKYRSLGFEQLVGQSPIAQTLINAITSGRVAHAYLFTGTRGVGKTTVARILAKALNCLSVDQPTPTPCNKCDACQAIAHGDDMDVVEIDGASNRGIDEIRELRANAIFRPARCRYKIYYIDEVHMLTREAFNALLKMLEEPPGHVKFIFATTEVEKVPATIVSRCQRFDFRNIPTRLIAEHLAGICKAEKVDADEDALYRIARAAAGSMRDGLSLLDQILAGETRVTDEEVVRLLGTPADERTLAVAEAIADSDAAAALTELDAVLAGGVTLGNAAAALGDVFRNMMLAATCGADSDLVELPETQRLAVAELAKRFSTPALVHAVAMCHSVTRSIRGSSTGRALLEAALVRLADAEKFIDPASLIERLEAMSGGAAGQKKKAAVVPGERKGNYASHNNRPRLANRGLSEEKKAVPVAIRWELSWLRSNWSKVIAALAARGRTQVAGALRPAKVLAFEDGVLRLGFDGHHETLRRRCDEAIGQAVEQSLTELAGKTIRCQYVALDADGANGADKKAPPPNRFGNFSTAEKAEIQKDPAVRTVMDLFGGSLVDIRKQPAQVDAPAADGDEKQ